MSARAGVLLSLLVACAARTASAIDETRRQVGSQSIDAAFNFTGNGVRLGQIDTGLPLDHNKVAYTARTATDGKTLHALEVASVMVSSDTRYSGMAPKASLFSDPFRDNGQAAGTIPGAGSRSENNFLDALRWMTTTNCRAVNFSDFVTIPGAPDPQPPNAKAALGIDWLVTRPRAEGGDFLFVKSSGNGGNSPVTEPGSNFNGITVGAVTSENYQLGTTTPQGPVNKRWGVVANYSSFGGPGGGIAKPEIVAPGGRIDNPDVGLTMAVAGNAFASTAGTVGTSFAAPHVTGIAAQLYEQAPMTDHRTMKAVLMNSADKTVRGVSHTGTNPADPYYRHLDPAWTAGQSGLDATSGAGMVDAWAASINLAGTPGGRIGTRTGNLANNAQPDFFQNFTIGVDTRVVATVTWDRQVTRTPPPPSPIPNPQDETFQPDVMQPHFALGIAGPNVVQNSAGGSVQHINTILNTPGNAQFVVQNNGAAPGAYSVAWAVSPVDVDPGTQDVYFTVRDQIHRPRAERTPPTGVADRIIEGRTGSEVRARSIGDSAGNAAEGVESNIYRSTMDGSNVMHRTAQQLGLQVAGDAMPDDSISDISFGRDGIRALQNQGGHVYFSVDTYATGLSPVVVNNPNNGVFGEANIVNEAAGDVFRSAKLLPGAGPITNANRNVKNSPNGDFLQPMGGANTNATFSDSYYMGLVGGRASDNEDDVTGLEGLGGEQFDPSVTTLLDDDFIFFSLDRGSPSGHTADVLVARRDMPGVAPRVYASATDLGLNDIDHIDGLLLEDFGALDAAGWPVYDVAKDLIVFSVDRDSLGIGGSAVSAEAVQGEVQGDLFFASVNRSNMLFLEATDLGLQEFAFGNGYTWLTDNLDALDIADAVIPEPSALALLAVGAAILVLRRRKA